MKLSAKLQSVAAHDKLKLVGHEAARQVLRCHGCASAIMPLLPQRNRLTSMLPKKRR